jgi:DNA topoisomerase I, bacterial
MGKKLVIVESPAKAKTIGKILGSSYVVKSSVGHIRDLPERTIGVDIGNGFAPKYVIPKDKTKVINELKKAAKECEEIFLAPDPDREGEAIAWHLQETLRPTAKDKPFRRVQYNEITPRAVKAAFEHPSDINQNRVDAQQARRVLDRIVGYMVSPMLWRRLQKGLSAGRVQSVALRLVAEREREIQNFNPVEYWVMGAEVRRETEPLDPFVVKLSRLDGKKAEIGTSNTAKALLNDLAGSSMRVAEIKDRDIRRHALPPFITSTLQQSASSFCGLSPNRTMSIAQKLYEGGFITYMRTDSVNIARDAQTEAMKYIIETYGKQYYPDQPNRYRSRESAQEAHEAIRPTDVQRTPADMRDKLDAQELKLYELIWKRFVASQMANAVITQRRVDVKPVKAGLKHDYLFSATASETKFDGFMKVTAMDFRKKTEDGEDDEDSDEIDRLPPLENGMVLKLVKWLNDRKETKPPARYSEASLIKALENNGVGRPSTYASIIETLNARKYTSREKRQLVPTELGLEVNDLLVGKLSRLFDVGFTATMENNLDQVEEGHVVWTKMLEDFYGKFTDWLEQAKEPPADIDKINTALAMLSEVRRWAPAVKRGKRIYDDKKFVASIREQLEKGEKPVTEKQLAALMRTAVNYREQIRNGPTRIIELGFGEELAKAISAPSREDAELRFKALSGLELNESQSAFVGSLRQQHDLGRNLSSRQLAALDRVITELSDKIDNFETLRQELKLDEVKPSASSNLSAESALVVKLLSSVKEWKKPVARGKRTFDDQTFFQSVAKQFASKHVLSPKQLAALKRMAARYKSQIPDFDRYSVQLQLNGTAGESNDGQADKE